MKYGNSSMVRAADRGMASFIAVLISVMSFAVPGIHAQTTGTLSIESNTTLTGNHTGNIFVSANNITLDCAGHRVSGGTGVGITLVNRTGVTVKNCVVENFQIGIRLSGSSGNSLLRNTVVGHGSISGQGIYLTSSSTGNLLEENTSSNNGDEGFRLDSSSSNNTLRGNTARHNAVSGYLFLSSNGNDIRNNTAENNGATLAGLIGTGTGFRLFTATANVLKRNTTRNNKSGFIFSNTSTGNTVSNNNIIENTTQISVTADSTGNIFNLAAPEGGNYWSDFDTPAEGCSDANGDGFCDSPRVFFNGQDNLPWTSRDGWARCIQPAAGLVSWWPGEGNANDVVNGNPGTLQNGVTFATGNVGQAFRFDGVNDFVRIPDAANLDVTSLTIEAWIKPNRVDKFQRIVSKGPPTSQVISYELFMNNLGKLSCLVSPQSESGGHLGTGSSSSITAGVWSHVACTYDQVTGVQRIYVNGVQEGFLNMGSGNPLVPNNQDLLIGDRAGFSSFFDGLIDEVAVYNRAVGSGDIQAVFNAGSAGKCVPQASCVAPPSGLISWWPLDETSGTTAVDRIGTDPGTHVNGPQPVAGKVGGALSFDGIDDFVRVEDSVRLSLTGSLTIDAWINLRSYPPEFAPIVSKWNDLQVSRRSYALTVIPDGSLRFDISTDGRFATVGPSTGPAAHASARNALVASSAKIPLNAFTHVAGVFDSNSRTLRVYVNGLESGSVVAPFSTIFDQNEPLLIGAGDSGSNMRDFTNGVIDEVEIYNRALSAGEIRAIFNAGSARKCTPADFGVSGPASGIFTNQNLLTITGTGIPGSLIDCFKEEDSTLTLIGGAICDEDGTWRLTTNVPLQEGSHSLRLIQRNPATGAEIGRSAPIVVNVDVTRPAPETTRFSASAGGRTLANGSIINTGQLTLSGSPGPAEAGSTIIVVVVDNVTGARREFTTTVDSNGNWSLGTTLPDCRYTISVNIRDQAGNLCDPIEDINITIDTTPPVVTCPARRTSAAGADCRSALPDLRSLVSVEDNLTDAAGLVRTQLPAPGELVGLGEHEITITVADAADNRSSCTVIVEVVDTTAPTFTSCPSPLKICAAPGTTSLPLADPRIASFLSSAAASDNCGLDSLTHNAPAGGIPVGCGSTMINFTAKDRFGNAATCLSHIDVSPSPLVTISPAAGTYMVGDPTSFAAVTSGGCGPSEFAWSITGPAAVTFTGNGSGIIALEEGFSTPGTYTVSVNLTDGKGCLASSNTSVRVVAARAVSVMRTPNCQGVPDGFDVVFNTDRNTSSLKASATNPGGLTYNLRITNTGDTTAVGATINVPLFRSSSFNSTSAYSSLIDTPAFVLWGSRPVHVYTGDPCGVGAVDVTSSAAISILAGSETLSQPLRTQSTLANAIVVSAPVPTSGQVWIEVHLRSRLLDTTGWTSNAGSEFFQNYAFRAPVSITNGSACSMECAITESVDVYTTGTGKRVTAIGGNAVDMNGAGKGGLRVVVDGTTVGGIPASCINPNATTENMTGFYIVPLAVGLSSTVRLYNSTCNQQLLERFGSVAQEQYVQVDFLNLNPADPVIEGIVATRLKGVAGVLVELSNASNRIISTTRTNSAGYYSFRFAAPGTYTVRVTPPEGYGTGVVSSTLTVKMFETVRADFTLTQ